MAKIFGFDTNKINIPTFVKSREGQAFLSFIAGKNSKQIADWLITLGQTMKGQGNLAAGTIVGKTLLKAEWLVAAVCIAAGTIKQAIDNGEKVFKTTDQRSGLGNILKMYWETSIPKATFDHLADFGKWLVTKPTKQESVTNRGPIKMASGNSSTGSQQDRAIITKTESGNQVVEYEKNKKGYQKPLETTSDKMVKFMANKNFKRAGTNGSNDASWYVKGKASKLMAGTFTWTTVKDNDREGNYPFAGVYTMNTMLNIPTVADSTNNNRIHPRIAEQVSLITSALRGKNTGAYNYQEEDVYNYIIEMSVIIARYNSIKRNLSMINRSNAFVEKEAEHMFNEIYFNASAYSSAVPDRPNYISRLNALATVINSKAVPSISLISKWNFMASKVFKDYNGDKAVIGQFNLITWPTVDRSTGNITAGYRVGNTIDADITELESQVASLNAIPSTLTSQAGVVNKISADFTKLLGANKATFDNVAYASITDLVEVKFDKAVFDQLHNAMVIGKCNNSTGNVRYASYDGTTSFHITNSTKVSTASVSSLASGAVPGCYDWNTNKFTPWLLTLDASSKEKSGAENIEITQFCFTSKANIVAGTNETKFERVFVDTPAALLMFGKILYYVPQASTTNTYAEYGCQTLETGTDVSKNLVDMAIEKQIDFYLPKISFDKVGSAVHCLGQDTDVDNYAYLNDNQFYYMNNVATYSLFHLYDPEDLQIKGILDVA